MFATSFWILAVWFVINCIWTFFATSNQSLMKTFAWINVVAVVWGFWVYYGAASVASLSGWFAAVNWLAVILAIVQFYFGYRSVHSAKQA